MNIQKHMEMIFICVLTIVGLGTAILENLPEAVAKTPLPIASFTATSAGMPVVVIRAPRASEHI